MDEILQATEKTKLKRLPKRGSFDRETIYMILDEAFVCHVGITVDEQLFVIPTTYARVGDNLLVRGSGASRMPPALDWEKEVCVTVTLIDGLVLARSAFHHSVNYRSVVIFGKATVVSDETEKFDALKAFTEHLIPSRRRDIRPPSQKELNATMGLSLPLDEVSAKIRSGDPLDDEDDYRMNTWAGVIPFVVSAGEPMADARLHAGLEIPAYVSPYKRTWRLCIH